MCCIFDDDGDDDDVAILDSLTKWAKEEKKINVWHMIWFIWLLLLLNVYYYIHDSDNL